MQQLVKTRNASIGSLVTALFTIGTLNSPTSFASEAALAPTVAGLEAATSNSLNASTTSTLAQGKPDCFEYYSAVLEQDTRYCLQRSRPDLPKASGEPVVFFFHGLLNDEDAYYDQGYFKALQDLAAHTPDLPSFTVVTFKTQKLSFFVNFRNRRTGPTSYESFFSQDLVRHVRRTHDLCQTRECTALAGYSMGGLGALNTAFRTKMASVVAVAVPAITPVSLYDSNSKWFRYWDKTRIGRIVGMGLVQWARRIIPTAKMAREHDPLWLVRNGDKTQFPDLYIQAGAKDDFGFDMGFKSFKNAIVGRGIAMTRVRRGHLDFSETPVAYDFNPDGNHTYFRNEDVAESLLKFLADRLEFHRKK